MRTKEGTSWVPTALMLLAGVLYVASMLWMGEELLGRDGSRTWQESSSAKTTAYSAFREGNGH